MFIGLVLGGLLAPISWRLIFLVSVPFGLFGTVWSYRSCARSACAPRRRSTGRATSPFALGLVLVMIGITYGIRPYGDSSMGWTSPLVLGLLAGGVACLARSRSSSGARPARCSGSTSSGSAPSRSASLSSFLSAVARGGLMFMLIIWLQGIWLPEHGYSFAQTPLWAGIYMLPLTVGILIAGPVSGYLSDRYGARPFATGGMLGVGAQLPPAHAAADRLLVPGLRGGPAPDGLSMGVFASPNRAGVMNSLPADAPRRRGRHEPDLPELRPGALDRDLLQPDDRRASPRPSRTRWRAASRPTAWLPRPRTTRARAPPISVLFASFLGYNPASHLLGHHVLAQLPHHCRRDDHRSRFFPADLGPFRTGLHEAFAFAIAACRRARLVVARKPLRRRRGPGDGDERGLVRERELRVQTGCKARSLHPPQRPSPDPPAVHVIPA